MSRISKLISITILVLFVLACNFVTQPIRDAQNVAGTAQSLATALLIETLKALATQIPVETLEAIPSSLPNFGNYFDPQGTPVEVWKDIPIPPQATAGQEFSESTYSFKADATLEEVQDFYNGRLVDLGWSQTFNVPADANGAIMVFSRGSNILTIAITSTDGSTVVILTLA